MKLHQHIMFKRELIEPKMLENRVENLMET